MPNKGRIQNGMSPSLHSWTLLLVGILGITLALLLHLKDPEAGNYPACAFHASTGLLCPGCGSLRALHDLSHARIGDAFQHNALLVLAAPLLLLQLLLWYLKMWRCSPGTGGILLVGWLLAIVGWGIMRNLG